MNISIWREKCCKFSSLKTLIGVLHVLCPTTETQLTVEVQADIAVSFAAISWFWDELLWGGCKQELRGVLYDVFENRLPQSHSGFHWLIMIIIIIMIKQNNCYIHIDINSTFIFEHFSHIWWSTHLNWGTAGQNVPNGLIIEQWFPHFSCLPCDNEK